MKRNIFHSSVIAGLVLMAVTLAAAQFPAPPEQPIADEQVAALNNPNLIFPSVRIIRFDEGVVRFDTQTAELSRFSGTLTGGAAAGSWLRHARPVADANSGFLDIKQVSGGTFLIDLETGQTWILRRGGTIGTWMRLQVR